MSTIHDIPNYYNGNNIKSNIEYYSPISELDDKIEGMGFIGFLSDKDLKIGIVSTEVCFEIAFIDNTKKTFPVEKVENKFTRDGFIDALKSADEYLEKLNQERHF